MMKKQRSRAGFTLIEMLVVIAIIGIMLGLALPAVTNLMKSGGVNAASREVSNALNLARQYAITHRTKTRVVFPYSATTGTKQAPQYLTYAVVAKDSTTLYGWAYVGKWEFLPLGVVFLSGGVGALSATLPATLQIDPAMPFPSTALGPASLAYIEFGPTGAASQSYTLKYEEGLINSSSGAPQTTSTNAALDAIDGIIGRIKVTHLP